VLLLKAGLLHWRAAVKLSVEAGWSKCEVIARLWRRCEFAAAFRSMS
jgi:hypothetical protein